MRRRMIIVVGIAGVIGAIALWRGSSSSTSSSTTKQARPVVAAKRVNAAQLVRGSVTGIVTHVSKPVQNARVCAIGANVELDPALFREPACAATDANGRYKLSDLLPARYSLRASAKPYRPSGKHIALGVGASLAKDIELFAGGVELAGVVNDVTGGAIAGAYVLADDAITQTDANGSFSLWTSPGHKRSRCGPMATPIGTRRSQHRQRSKC